MKASEVVSQSGVDEGRRTAVQLGTLSGDGNAMEEKGGVVDRLPFLDQRVVRSKKRNHSARLHPGSGTRLGKSRLFAGIAVLAVLLISVVAFRFIACLKALPNKRAARAVPTGVASRKLSGSVNEAHASSVSGSGEESRTVPQDPSSLMDSLDPFDVLAECEPDVEDLFAELADVSSGFEENYPEGILGGLTEVEASLDDTLGELSENEDDFDYILGGPSENEGGPAAENSGVRSGVSSPAAETASSASGEDADEGQ
ncbi:hypothetical protein CSUI_005415 [Cystoisospora suis]|uniref:Transmembrane protein n=1 Tax=Cystoisospora suis TaxID=483139 RepID=A0A2C6KXL9_9APIC|nr:hypothetical protein CSUI_005415 [Cystoisospora suis]